MTIVDPADGFFVRKQNARNWQKKSLTTDGLGNRILVFVTEVWMALDEPMVFFAPKKNARNWQKKIPLAAVKRPSLGVDLGLLTLVWMA